MKPKMSDFLRVNIALKLNKNVVINHYGRPQILACPCLILPVCDLSRLKRATWVPPSIHKSAFFKLCFFFDGFEITFIVFDSNWPNESPLP